MALAAVVNFSSKNIVKSNLNAAISFIQQASKQGSKAIFFPEATDFIATSSQESLELCKESHEFMESIKRAAREHRIAVSIGVHEVVPDDHSRLFNTHYLVENDGLVVAKYRKLHLFDVDIDGKDGKVQLLESKHTRKGADLVKPTACSSLQDCSVGLQICYDLRFAEPALLLRKMGADILTYPSAFSVPTGQMGHWHTLLKARAIETQTYVVAAAQAGSHNEKRCSFGHALVADPLGKIVVEFEGSQDDQQVGFKLFNIDFDLIQKTRLQMPVFAHRRDDVYTIQSK